MLAFEPQRLIGWNRNRLVKPALKHRLSLIHTHALIEQNQLLVLGHIVENRHLAIAHHHQLLFLERI